MSETNLEHYKEQLKEIIGENFDDPSDIFDKIQNNIDSEITINASQVTEENVKKAENVIKDSVDYIFEKLKESD